MVPLAAVSFFSISVGSCSSFAKPRSFFSHGPKSSMRHSSPSRWHRHDELLSAVREFKFQRQQRLHAGDESISDPDLALAIAILVKNFPAFRIVRRPTEQPPSCVFFISRSCSITCCFCSLGRTSMRFCTGSGRWRAMTSGSVAVANSSSAACGVVPCHANKGTADNSVARSQWLFIEHLRENQTPGWRRQFPLLFRTMAGNNLAGKSEDDG
jgi:hypothetical protein